MHLHVAAEATVRALGMSAKPLVSLGIEEAGDAIPEEYNPFKWW